MVAHGWCAEIVLPCRVNPKSRDNRRAALFPEPVRLGELLRLPEFEPGDGQDQASCGAAAAHTPDEAPQGEKQRSRRRPAPECGSIPAPWVIQGSYDSGLALGACLGGRKWGQTRFCSFRTGSQGGRATRRSTRKSSLTPLFRKGSLIVRVYRDSDHRLSGNGVSHCSDFFAEMSRLLLQPKHNIAIERDALLQSGSRPSP